MNAAANNELQRALAGLRDIHLPDGAASIGGLVDLLGRPELGALGILTLLGLGALWWRLQAPRRLSLRSVNQLAALHARNKDTLTLLAGLTQLLRTRAAAMQQDAATRTGESWLRWLDEHGPAPNVRAFSEGVGRVLLDTPYRPPTATVDVDVAALLALVRDWLVRAR